MMKRIQFLHFSKGNSTGPNTFTFQRIEPGVSWVAGAVKEAEVDVIDCDLISSDEILNCISEFYPNFIGISAFTPGYPRSKRIGEVIKKRFGIPIIYGGWHASLKPLEVLEDKIADVVVTGRGEGIINDLIRNFWKYKDSKVDGNLFRQNFSRPFRKIELMKDYYIDSPGSEKNAGSIVLALGCRYKCTFCATPVIYGNKMDEYPIDEVISDVQFLVDHSVGIISLRDENPMLAKNHLAAFCYKIIERGLHKKVKFRAFGHINHLDEEILSLLKKSGFIELYCGIESFDNNRLAELNKGTSLLRIKKAFELMRGGGIFTAGNYMLWQPGDNVSSFENVEISLKKVLPDRATLSFFTPYPGTSDWDRCKPYLRAGYESKYEFFNGEFPILDLENNITPKELIDRKNRVLAKYYSSHDYKNLVQYRSRQFGEKDFYRITSRFRDRILMDHAVDIWKHLKIE